jgi:hypothetical protein
MDGLWSSCKGVLAMAIQIEIHRSQVADLIRAHPGISERDLYDLIVQNANDRRMVDDTSCDHPVYVGKVRTELSEFVRLVREDMKNGTAHIR